MERNSTLKYLTIVLAAVLSIIFSAVLTNYTKRNLTYKAWIPFDYSSPVLFTLVFTHQLIGMSTSGLVNVACDGLVCGFLLHICCQIEILEYRLGKITQGQNVLNDCIRHHNRIFEYANRINYMFVKIIAIQFAVSMLVVCSNMFRIAMAENYIIFIQLMFYAGATLTQVFIYCWFGNEVKLKSLHLMSNIYDMEWPILSNNNKKALLIIMKRSMIPIQFNSVYIITMDLDTFIALLKMSYSIFNLLRQAQY